MTAAWTIVVPVKGTDGAKSRLAATPEQARAIALDTVAAALAVAPVVVVTHPSAGPAFRALGSTVVVDPGRGLDAAVLAGIAACPPGPTAVLQGDLPALRPAELERALAAARWRTRAVVPDARGTGTVLLTARRACDHRPHLGAGSARRHRAVGYALVAVPARSGLRRDVDTTADLAVLGSGVGPRTRAAFGL